jgi:hypothetical protein
VETDKAADFQPLLFITHMNALKKKWRQMTYGYIHVGRNLQIHATLCVDNLALLASRDDLQCSIYDFNTVVSKYNMEKLQTRLLVREGAPTSTNPQLSKNK